MSDLVRNPDDRFSRIAAHMVVVVGGGGGGGGGGGEA